MSLSRWSGWHWALEYRYVLFTETVCNLLDVYRSATFLTFLSFLDPRHDSIVSAAGKTVINAKEQYDRSCSLEYVLAPGCVIICGILDIFCLFQAFCCGHFSSVRLVIWLPNWSLLKTIIQVYHIFTIWRKGSICLAITHFDILSFAVLSCAKGFVTEMPIYLKRENKNL